MNNEELKIIEKDLKEMDERIDKHIEAYAKNGRELVRLSGLVETHIREDKNFKDKLYPVLESYQTITNGSKMVRGVAYFVVAVGVLAKFIVKFMNK